MLSITWESYDDGFLVVVRGEGYRFLYPEEVWKPFPCKEAFITEFIYVLTFPLPLLTRSNSVSYSTTKPKFLETYNRWFLAELPSLTKGIWNESGYFWERAFGKVDYTFSQDQSIDFSEFQPQENKAILGFTSGKDSIASLIVAQELGLSPVGVYLEHAKHDSTNLIRLSHFDSIRAKTGLPIFQVRDETRHLCDYSKWNQKRTALSCALELPRYCLTMLPFAYHFNSKYLLLGNEFEYNVPRKKGFSTLHVEPTRTVQGMHEMNEWISRLTHGAVQVTSLVQSVSCIGISKVMYHHQESLGLHQISCRYAGLTEAGRWCGSCEVCSTAYINMHAFGKNPNDMGFNCSMFTKEKKKLFSVPSVSDPFEQIFYEQELLGLSLSVKNGAEGWIIDQFIKKKSKEAALRYQELVGNYLSVKMLHKKLPLHDQSNLVLQRILSQFEAEA